MGPTTMQIEKPTIENVRAIGRIRKLITSLPQIAMCNHAERLSVMFGAAYDRAYENGTALDCTGEDLEIPGNRLQVINPMNWAPGNVRKAMIGWARLVIAESRCYLEKKRIGQNQFDSTLAIYKEEASMPDFEIDAMLTYEQAVTASFWWF